MFTRFTIPKKNKGRLVVYPKILPSPPPKKKKKQQQQQQKQKTKLKQNETQDKPFASRDTVGEVQIEPGKETAAEEDNLPHIR